VNYIQNNCKITWDNKLRQFYFKLLHRILVTNKELNWFGIPTDCVKCVLCHENDSIKHAFFDCQSFLKLCVESLQWFSNLHQINVSLTSLQCFLNLPTPNTNLSDNQTKDLRLLLLYANQYHYACKTMQKQDTSEFISKFIIQLETDKWLDVTMLPFPPAIYICTNLERHIVCNIYYRIHYRLFFISILSVVTTLFFALIS